MAAHQPVLLNEALAALAIRPDGIYLDATFGRGGHAQALLAQLGPHGRLIALDRDPQAVQVAQQITDPRFSITHVPFSALHTALDAQGVQTIHGALFDLGVSSPQLDEAQRGFSFRTDGPLDMRMDTTRGESVADWLQHAAETDIRKVIAEYGEERFAQQIAAAIVAARATEPIRRTRQLAHLVGQTVRTREVGQDPATRTFQALRIFINRELEEVALSLPLAMQRLALGARLAVISFHSLEDRIVKRCMQAASVHDLPRGLPIRDVDLPRAPMRLIGRAQRASSQELKHNPRARSATLRVAERTDGTLDLAALHNRLGTHPWRS